MLTFGNMFVVSVVLPQFGEAKYFLFFSQFFSQFLAQIDELDHLIETNNVSSVNESVIDIKDNWNF